MMPLKLILMVILFLNALFVHSCQRGTIEIQYKKWTVLEKILSHGPKGMFDDVAVKDPSIVFYKNKYHLFYTSKTVKDFPGGIRYITGLGYISAPTLNQLNNTKRYDINAMVDDIVIASQIFYFEPHQKWYIIAYTRVNNASKLAPVYMTNPNIEDVYGWSKPKLICKSRPNREFWIDFWVICDQQNAHMFYTDQNGSLFRLEISLDKFPLGFSDAKENVIFSVSGENYNGKWRLYDACHVYHVKSLGKYLAIIEGAYPHPTNPFYWDARNRFQFALIADSLRGQWRRVEGRKNSFFVDPRHVNYPDFWKESFTQVSHTEIIRSGYNQEMEIKDCHIDLLFQGFNGSKISDDYNYNELPWEISLMKNY